MLNRLLRTTPGKKKHKKNKEQKKIKKTKTKTKKKPYECLLYFSNKLKRILPCGKEGFINY
jgi:hypothetical protein